MTVLSILKRIFQYKNWDHQPFINYFLCLYDTPGEKYVARGLLPKRYSRNEKDLVRS